MIWNGIVNAVNGARRPGEPPLEVGPLPWLGSALAFGKNLGDLLRGCQQRHGDVFTLVVAGKRMTFVLDPLDFPEVLRRVEELSFVEIADDISAKAFGHSRAVEKQMSQEAVHAQYSSHLKAANIGALSARMAEELSLILDDAPGGWQPGELFAFVSRCMFSAGTDALFGSGVAGADALRAFQRFDRQFPLLVAGVPARLLARVERSRQLLAGLVGALRPDASAFIAERDRYFTGLVSELDKQRMQLGMLWAAQANTIPAAFWTLAFVLADRHARAAIDEEIAAAGGRFGKDELKKMVKLDSAISEALRLSSGSLTIRRVTRPFVLALESGGRHALREGDRVCLFPYLTHRDPELYPEPEHYQFDRFLGKQFFKRGKKVGFALMPYGGGVSMCPGRFLAHEEVKLFVAMLLDRYEVELLDDRLPSLDQRRAGLGILPPLSDVAFRYRRKAAARATAVGP